MVDSIRQRNSPLADPVKVACRVSLCAKNNPARGQLHYLLAGAWFSSHTF